jgi:hypothetical protein
LLATSSEDDYRVTVVLGGDGEIALQGGCERVLLSGAEHSIDAQPLELWTVHTYLNRAVSVHFGHGFAQRQILEEHASIAPTYHLGDVYSADHPGICRVLIPERAAIARQMKGRDELLAGRKENLSFGATVSQSVNLRFLC